MENNHDLACSTIRYGKQTASTVIKTMCLVNKLIDGQKPNRMDKHG
jgi:hypothetical protein